MTATQVWILGRRNATTSVWAIDRFSLTGVRDDTNSDILVRGITDPRGLNLNSSVTQAWVASLNGDYVAGLLLRSAAGQRRKLSYDATFPVLSESADDIEVKDRILYTIDVDHDHIKRRSLSSGTALSNWSNPSGISFKGIAKAGNFLYVVSTLNRVYRIDLAQSTPVFTILTGTISTATNFFGITIVNDRIYVRRDEGAIQYLTLTGSASAGYTAVSTTFTVQSIGTGHGLAGTAQSIASYSTFIYQSSSGSTGTQAIAHGWDYTAGSGDFIGQANDISTSDTVQCLIAVDTDGTFYASQFNQLGKLFAFYPTGAQTANIMSIDHTHSFPLGSRQASTYGFGYDETNDRFMVPNVTRVNTYDKAVVSTVRNWVPMAGLNIPSRYPLGVEFLGAKLYVLRGTRNSDPAPESLDVYSYPDFNFERRLTFSRGSLMEAFFEMDGRLWGAGEGAPVPAVEIFPLTGTLAGSAALSFNTGDSIADQNRNIISGSDDYIWFIIRRNIKAFSKATIATNLSEVTAQSFSVDYSSYRAGFIWNAHIYMWRNNNADHRFSFDAYDLSSKNRVSNQDFIIDLPGVDLGISQGVPGIKLIGNVLYISHSTSDTIYAFVRAV